MAAQHRSLRRALRTGPVDAVLADVAFTGVLPTLLAGAPRPAVLACGVVPLMLSSVDAPPFGMGWPPTRRRDYPAMNWVVHRLLFGPTQARADHVLRALGGPRLPVFLTDWPKLADRHLQLTVPSFEYPRRDLPPTVTFTGPVLPEAPPRAALPAWWPELAGSRPVIHVAQGTWDNTDLDRLIGPALRALAREDVLVVATTGGPPPGELPTPVPANTRVAEFLPYQTLLPQVDVMITNGGYGGVQHALAHGVPLVVAGDTADKPETAARVAYTGAGIDLRTGTPTERALATAVRTVLHTSTYRQHARRLARDIAATRPLDTIAKALTVFGGQGHPGRLRSNPYCR